MLKIATIPDLIKFYTTMKDARRLRVIGAKLLTTAPKKTCKILYYFHDPHYGMIIFRHFNALAFIFTCFSIDLQLATRHLSFRLGQVSRVSY